MNRSPSIGATFASALALLGVAVAQLWPGLSNGLAPPIGFDHGAHLGKAIQTANELWPSLRGWSDLVETGVPLNTVYTPTGTLWILLFRGVTPFLEWHQTYAVAFVGVRVAVALAVWRLSVALGVRTWVAVLAGVVALADHGIHSEGGWFYDVDFGVWPMSLAVAFFFVGLAKLLDYLRAGAPGDGVASAIWLGIALFSHQMNLVAVAMVVPVIVLARAADGAALERDVRRLIATLAPAGLLASWWLLPMFAHGAWLDDHAQLYESARAIGTRLAAGQTFFNGGVWTNVLAVLGLGVAVFARGPRRILALYALLAMFVGSGGWFEALDASRVMPPLGRIVFPRLFSIAKPALFALGAVVLEELVRLALPELRRATRDARARFGVALGLLALAPFAVGVPATVSKLVFERSTTTTASLATWNDWQAAWAWVRALPRDEFFRVAYFDESSHLAQASGAYTDRPFHVTGILVGEAFSNTTDSTRVDALRAINVRYVVSFASLHGALGRACRVVATFGAARICELEGWSSAVVSDRIGAARPRVRHLENERVGFEPRGARDVVVRRAFAPGWRAFADGREIPILTERVPDSPRLRFMRLEVPAGVAQVELRYSLGARVVAAYLLTALGVWLLIGVGGRRALGWRSAFGVAERAWARVRVSSLAPWAARWAWIACAAPVVAAAALIARNLSGIHYAYELDRARVLRMLPNGEQVDCTVQSAPSAACGGALSAVRDAFPVDGRFHSCIHAEPPTSGALVLRFEGDELAGRTLVLGGGIHDDQHGRGEGEPVRVVARIGDREVQRLVVPNGREWVERRVRLPDLTGPLSFEVRTRATDRRWFCFDAVVR